MSSRTAQALVVTAFVLLLRLPFLNEAIQGDDVYYLKAAEYAQTDPLHPHHARFPFQGVMVDMRGHPHPPLDAWVLAGLLAATGDIQERVYHGAYIVFSLVAALAMLALARRFSPRPLLATLLFMAAPAFVVNGTSLEADLPFLAFWMAAVVLFVAAEETRSVWALAGSAVAMGLAALTGFQAVALVPVLAAYLLARRSRWGAAWATLAAPLVVLAGWQLWERLASGALPASVLAGYFETYGLQRVTAKLRNAATLTAHTAWLVFPVIAAAAFFHAPKRIAAVIAVAMAALAVLVDPNPLFWASWGMGALVVAECVWAVLKGKELEERFLGAWVTVFFAFAVAVFFAGSARYLLPMVAPVAILATRRLVARPVLLTSGLVAGFALGLGLATANYQHWDGYRRFVENMRGQIGKQRTWVNGEWGLRYYAEAEGALPLERTSPLRAGDLVLTSMLGGFAAASGPRRLVEERVITSWLPFRLIGLGSHSGYSTAAEGLRPFDISRAPIDRVRAELVAERQPTLSYLPMNAAEAPDDIVGGLGNLEGGGWRWTTARRAAVALKAPEGAAPLEASFVIPENAPARRIRLLVDGRVVAEETYPGPGKYTLRSEVLTLTSRSVTVALEVDRTFRVPGDERDLGVVLEGIGFRGL